MSRGCSIRISSQIETHVGTSPSTHARIARVIICSRKVEVAIVLSALRKNGNAFSGAIGASSSIHNIAV